MTNLGFIKSSHNNPRNPFPDSLKNTGWKKIYISTVYMQKQNLLHSPNGTIHYPSESSKLREEFACQFLPLDQPKTDMISYTEHEVRVSIPSSTYFRLFRQKTVRTIQFFYSLFPPNLHTPFPHSNLNQNKIK